MGVEDQFQRGNRRIETIDVGRVVVGKIYIQVERVWSSSPVSGKCDTDKDVKEGQGAPPVRSIDGLCWRRTNSEGILC